MIQVGFVPNISRNTTAQLRRRTNQLVTGATALDAEKAPAASPTFSGTVTQQTPAVLTAAVTATSATAGSASALPTTPLGYMTQVINGQTVKIPYYAE
jgi:hypothetical protein